MCGVNASVNLTVGIIFFFCYFFLMETNINEKCTSFLLLY